MTSIQDRIIRDPEQLALGIANDREIAVDIETSGLNPWRDKTAVISIKGYPSETVGVIHDTSGKFTPQLKKAMMNVPKWITFNGTNFDLHFLKEIGVAYPKEHYDGLIGEQVLATTPRKNIRKTLDATMMRRLGKSFKGKANHDSWMQDELDDTQIEYATNDINYLRDIMVLQKGIAHEKGMDVAMNKEQELSLIVAEIVDNGMVVTEQSWSRSLIQFIEKSIEAQEILDKEFYPGFNVKSPDQVKKALTLLTGVEPPDTKAATLMMLRDRVPMAQVILDCREGRDRISRYSEEWFAKYVTRDRVRGRYWQAGTETFRFSSSDPNLEQFPRNMRGMVGGEDDYMVVAADYAQLEVRLAAHITKDRNFIAALDSEDFHTFMAQMMFNKSDVSSTERRDGKPGTFTMVFDGGAKGIIEMGRKQGIQITRETANKMLANFSKRFPTMKKYHKDLEDRARLNKVTVLKLPWNHRRVLTPPFWATVMMNNLVQGRAAIGFKEGMFEAHKAGLTKYIGGLIHDEIVATHVPNNEAEEYGHELQQAMIRGMVKVCDTVPILVDLDVGKYWIP